jgi:hypothetical protein
MASASCRSPRVERVRCLEARVQRLLHPRERDVAHLGEGHTEVARQVGEHRALAAGVVHGRDPPARADPTRRREQLHGVGELVEGADLVDAVCFEQRLVGAVLPGERPRVRHHHREGPLGPPDFNARTATSWPRRARAPELAAANGPSSRPHASRQGDRRAPCSHYRDTTSRPLDEEVGRSPVVERERREGRA